MTTPRNKVTSRQLVGDTIRASEIADQVIKPATQQSPSYVQNARPRDLGERTALPLNNTDIGTENDRICIEVERVMHLTDELQRRLHPLLNNTVDVELDSGGPVLSPDTEFGNSLRAHSNNLSIVGDSLLSLIRRLGI